ncbi:unnamed protein product [Darwinula stevensoni]|uniref:Uncharacterized protein n=1 Tax=Darwinula stevensoni TaxID=69355 RepID=A0A7R8XBX3_9CRUS|nr:unnamed protein product [Darwinula stevensoni]CAG0893239.1 unnamed protein product [Darwinula stevensoni]
MKRLVGERTFLKRGPYSIVYPPSFSMHTRNRCLVGISLEAPSSGPGWPLLPRWPIHWLQVDLLLQLYFKRLHGPLPLSVTQLPGLLTWCAPETFMERRVLVGLCTCVGIADTDTSDHYLGGRTKMASSPMLASAMAPAALRTAPAVRNPASWAPHLISDNLVDITPKDWAREACDGQQL